MADYTQADITRGLNALIAFGGAPTPAQRALKATFDLTVPVGTLRDWKDHTHAERYAQLQVEHGREIEDAMTREIRDLARAASIAERMAVEKVIDEMSQERPRVDPAQVALNMSKVKDSNINKLLALTGRPQQITEHRSAAELIRSLEAKGVIKQIPTKEGQDEREAHEGQAARQA